MVMLFSFKGFPGKTHWFSKFKIGHRCVFGPWDAQQRGCHFSVCAAIPGNTAQPHSSRWLVGGPRVRPPLIINWWPILSALFISTTWKMIYLLCLPVAYLQVKPMCYGGKQYRIYVSAACRHKMLYSKIFRATNQIFVFFLDNIWKTIMHLKNNKQ